MLSGGYLPVADQRQRRGQLDQRDGQWLGGAAGARVPGAEEDVAAGGIERSRPPDPGPNAATGNGVEGALDGARRRAEPNQLPADQRAVPERGDSLVDGALVPQRRTPQEMGWRCAEQRLPDHRTGGGIERVEIPVPSADEIYGRGCSVDRHRGDRRSARHAGNLRIAVAVCGLPEIGQPSAGTRRGRVVLVAVPRPPVDIHIGLYRLGGNGPSGVVAPQHAQVRRSRWRDRRFACIKASSRLNVKVGRPACGCRRCWLCDRPPCRRDAEQDDAEDDNKEAQDRPLLACIHAAPVETPARTRPWFSQVNLVQTRFIGPYPARLILKQAAAPGRRSSGRTVRPPTAAVRRQRPQPVPVPLPCPHGGALVRQGADHRAQLGLDQRLVDDLGRGRCARDRMICALQRLNPNRKATAPNRRSGRIAPGSTSLSVIIRVPGSRARSRRSGRGRLEYWRAADCACPGDRRPAFFTSQSHRPTDSMNGRCDHLAPTRVTSGISVPAAARTRSSSARCRWSRRTAVRRRRWGSTRSRRSGSRK